MVLFIFTQTIDHLNTMGTIIPFNDFIQVAGVIDSDESQLLMDCGVL